MGIAINGFGRIGRTFLRVALQQPSLQVVAINDLADAETLAHLFKYDSVHGVFAGSVEVENNHLLINGQAIQIFSEKNPERAQRVADRMNTRASRIERGKEIANPSTREMIQNPAYEYKFEERLMKKSEDDSKMKMGGKLKPVDKTKKPGLAKLPKAVRNKMGFKKNGGAMSKKK